ncbi:MAG: hypothetical protein ABH876_00960 [Patescibacteria group bacterium]|nr:hypothetical protein [Patescibacteria group bacterium]MBU1876928.1 hypothetical protein [Patescibacteria group bacterium]
MKNFKSIQDLPEQKRKIILWTIMVLTGLSLLIIYIKGAREKIENLEIEKFKEEIQLQSLEEELGNLLKIEIPNIQQEIQE